MKSERDCHLGAGGQEVGHEQKLSAWWVVRGCPRSAGSRRSRVQPLTTHLLQFRQPVLDSTIVRELSCHRLQNRPGAVPHAGGGERVGAEQPDPEPEEATVEQDWEGGSAARAALPSFWSTM